MTQDMLEQENRLLSMLAERTRTDRGDWYAVFKARHGMQVAFESVRAVLGAGYVSTQLLTCCTAVDPILVGGLLPCYCEISPSTAAIDPRALNLGPEVRAVVLQHTYGVVDNTSSCALASAAHAARAIVLEDSAHCLARMARDETGAPVADVSVHSFGIEKMVPSHFGAAVWVNPRSQFADFTSELRSRLNALEAIGWHLGFLTHTYIDTVRVLGHLPGKTAHMLRVGLPKIGLFEPGVSEAERRGGISHPPMRPGESVCKRAADAMLKLDAIERQRVSAVEIYRSGLKGLPGVEIPEAITQGAAQPLLRLPILVRNTETADAIIKRCCDAGYYTSAWYRPELCPGVSSPDVYRIPTDRSRLCECDRFVACVAPLPTDHGPAEITEIVDMVRSTCGRV